MTFRLKKRKMKTVHILIMQKKIIDTMKQKQTADVDVASGATYSSKGIIAAVRNALKEAS